MEPSLGDDVGARGAGDGIQFKIRPMEVGKAPTSTERRGYDASGSRDRAYSARTESRYDPYRGYGQGDPAAPRYPDHPRGRIDHQHGSQHGFRRQEPSHPEHSYGGPPMWDPRSGPPERRHGAAPGAPPAHAPRHWPHVAHPGPPLHYGGERPNGRPTGVFGGGGARQGGGGGGRVADYFGDSLPQQYQDMYKAAGVVLYSFDEEGELHILMGVEERKRSKGAKVLMIFGGKREKSDPDGEFTAIRELHEETRGVLGKGSHFELYYRLRAQRFSKSKVLYRAGGKYCLYCIPCPTGLDTSMHSKFQQLLVDVDVAGIKAGSDHPMLTLEWVKWSMVEAALADKELLVELSTPLESGESSARVYKFAIDLLDGLRRSAGSLPDVLRPHKQKKKK